MGDTWRPYISNPPAGQAAAPDPDEPAFGNFNNRAATQEALEQARAWERAAQDSSNALLQANGSVAADVATNGAAADASAADDQHTSAATPESVDRPSGGQELREQQGAGDIVLVPPKPEQLQEPLPADAMMCGNLDDGSFEFLVYGIVAHGISCESAVTVARAYIDDELQLGWKCEQAPQDGATPLTNCFRGHERVSFH